MTTRHIDYPAGITTDQNDRWLAMIRKFGVDPRDIPPDGPIRISTMTSPSIERSLIEYIAWVRDANGNQVRSTSPNELAKEFRWETLPIAVDIDSLAARPGGLFDLSKERP